MKTNFHPYSEYRRATYILGFILLSLIGIQSFILKENYQEIPKKVQFLPVLTSTKPLSNFNPNNYDLKDWKSIGFSDKEAKTIIKYKNILGGTFTSKEQLKKCYSISDEKYKEIEKYILLPDKIELKTEKSTWKKIHFTGKFNPNSLSHNDWVKLGFSEKQSESILKYKNYLGGNFKSKEDIRNCFIINHEIYEEMKYHILLPEKNIKAETNSNHQLFAFDPNTLDAVGFQKLGFSEKQVNSILNYRDKILKGSFKNIDEFKKCFVISDEKFNELKPYISLSKIQLVPQQTDFSSIDLNKITFKQLIEFGFDEKAAGSFIGFRKKLGGFANTQQMLDTYNIDKELMQKLINTAKFSTESITKYNLIDAPEDWLKNHPYFKYSADKIIFYRTSYQDEKQIWKALKLKSEYETKMKWYLK